MTLETQIKLPLQETNPQRVFFDFSVKELFPRNDLQAVKRHARINRCASYLYGADGVEKVFDLFLGGGRRQAVDGHRAGLRLADSGGLPVLRGHPTATSAAATPSTRDHHLRR